MPTTIYSQTIEVTPQNSIIPATAAGPYNKSLTFQAIPPIPHSPNDELLIAVPANPDDAKPAPGQQLSLPIDLSSGTASVHLQCIGPTTFGAEPWPLPAAFKARIVQAFGGTVLTNLETDAIEQGFTLVLAVPGLRLPFRV